jgi:ABC-type transport system substrate-binding protein
MRKSFFSLSRREKLLLFLFFLGFLFSLSGITYGFWVENSEGSQAQGGEYIEGVIGTPSSLVLNPVFIPEKRENSLDADISNLIFSGLMRYNSKTGEVEDFLATHTLSIDKKIYTFVLKQGLRWHDGVEVTANDVVFTFENIIQNKRFSNKNLQRIFQSVKVTKLSEYSVSFTLSEPYKFFLSNFTIGLLPRHILESVDIENLEFHEFSSNPIGCGPYSFEGIEEVRPGVMRLNLKAFRESSISEPYINNIAFQFFPNKDALSISIQEISAVRPFQTAEENISYSSAHMQARTFSLPQYAAVFFNLSEKVFTGEEGANIRNALSLSTDKNALLKKIPGKRIDTPFLEIEDAKWEAEFSLEKAKESLKKSGFFPLESIPKTEILPQSENTWILTPTQDPQYQANEGIIPLKGTAPDKTISVAVFSNDNRVKKVNFSKDDLTWDTNLEENTSINIGKNKIKIQFFDSKKKLLSEDALSLYLPPQKWRKGKIAVSDSIQPPASVSPEKNEVTPSFSPIASENVSPSSAEIRTGVSPVQTVETTISPEPIPIEENIEPEPTDILYSITGEPLSLNLITPSRPSYYGKIAEILKTEWRKVGIEVRVSILEPEEFFEKMGNREYDLLLFGESLGYNLDVYPYFHESQVKDGGGSGLNLSEYRSPEASVLIEDIRKSHDEQERRKKLEQLQSLFQKDIPAIFLFSPSYTFLQDKKIRDHDLTHVAFLRDRFSNVDKWYTRTQKILRKDASWNSFPSWFSQKISHLFS